MSSPRAKKKASRASHHTKRPSAKISKKKASFGGFGSFFKNPFAALFASSPGGTEDQARHVEHPDEEMALATTPEMTTEERQEQIARVVEELGITTSAENGRIIDRLAELRQEEQDKAKFKKSNPNFNSKIGPLDPAWKKKRDFFVKELKAPTKTIMDIFQENFPNYETVEKLYLLPLDGDPGIILFLQEEDTKEYKKAFDSTSRFHGVLDNLATKLTMLHFGLPIEPITENNISMSAEVDENGVGDKDCPPDPDPDPPSMQRVIFAQKPLEFLDSYEEGRSHGYPMLRRPKQRDLAPPLVLPAPVFEPTAADPVSTGSPEDLPAQNSPIGHHGHRVSMRGGALPVQIETEDEDTDLPEPDSASPASDNYIYGFSGKFLCSNDADSFKDTALRLLGYDPEAPGRWNFLVDFYGAGDVKPKTSTIRSNEYHNVFPTTILPYLQGATWRVFVRRTVMGYNGHSGGVLEPCRKSMKDVIRLVDADAKNGKKANNVYWKVPKNMKLRYGINQCQPGFYGAMKLLYHDYYKNPAPPGVITVRFKSSTSRPGVEYKLGWGGMEATVELWNAICVAIPELNPEEEDSIDLLVGNSLNESSENNRIGAHLTGDTGLFRASVTNPDTTYKQIKKALSGCIGKPTAFRIWHDAQERDNGSEGEVIVLKKYEAVPALNEFFRGWNTGGKDTNCCWFRPEWKSFEVRNVDSNPVKVSWPGAPASQGLEAFKTILKQLPPDGMFDSFSLTEGQSPEDGRHYEITKHTTDQEWRTFVYDWLHNNRIFVKKNTNVDYVLEDTPWAAPFPIGTVGPAEEVTPPVDNIGTHLINKPDSPDNAPVSAPLPVRQSLGPNKERIIRFPAGKQKSQKWATWMTEQHFLDGLQRKSWIKDQSVIEPGRLPAPPLYGATRELQMRVGTSMPTIFAQRLTPTDIKQLQDENQKLRNQVLDRMFACPICDEEFETYDKEKIREHVGLHQEQLKEAGKCPSCGDPQWAFMTNDEKRTHFVTHQHQRDTARIKSFYEGQVCPVCDRDLSKLSPENIIRHCLEHAPGQLQFCDRCGLNEAACTAKELRHHDLKCHPAGQTKPGDLKPFSHAGTSAVYCAKCGLDETDWNATAVAKHDSHCKPPGGSPKTFCKKCGIELARLDAAGIANHQRTCLLVEPVPSDRDRLIEIKKRQDILRETEARLNTLQSFIHNRQEDLDLREQMLVKRENEVEGQQFAFDHMKAIVAKMKPDNSSQEDINDDDNHVCPVELCSATLSRLSKAEAVAHIRTHAHNDLAPPFTCPLMKADGSRCNTYLSLKDDGFDLTYHYQHKLSAEEQDIVANNVAKTLGGSLLSAQHQNIADKAFIDARKHLLYPQTLPPHQAHHSPKSVTKTAASHAQTSPPSSKPPVSHPATGKSPGTTTGPLLLPQGIHTFYLADGSEITQDEALATLPASTLAENIRDAAVTTRAAAEAHRKLAEARRRRAALQDSRFKPLRDEDSDESLETEASAESEMDITLPPPKKKGRPAKTALAKAAPAKTAPEKPAPAPVATKKRKAPVKDDSAAIWKKRRAAAQKKQAAKVLEQYVSSDTEEDHAPPTKKKSAVAKAAPAKKAPVKSATTIRTKRKQAEEEEDVMVPKKSSSVTASSPPVRKKQKTATVAAVKPKGSGPDKKKK